ncbi:hypothetical protein CSB45_10260 [candidate division KSB3 bacterium]|uniref:Uncharacterized protein n=1 Tax=candidate division KSB3 bacterium TaxID=2044937 RepID=A0A2G6E3D5_9BACT|nr:MAG: hypothetical protein CSB45_10260 [candidate division KSB3 bacterium]PIE29202.1 MAG: hypothetical protein CSA57_10365 [candidate division KSB3 bacterium]
MQLQQTARFLHVADSGLPAVKNKRLDKNARLEMFLLSFVNLLAQCGIPDTYNSGSAEIFYDR